MQNYRLHLRHEGKRRGVGPMEGKVWMTYFLRPAATTEKNTLNDYPPLKALIAGSHDPQILDSTMRSESIFDTKRLQKRLFDCLPIARGMADASPP